MRKLTVLIITAFYTQVLFASTPPREGMWIPILLDAYNLEEMQAMGMELTAEDIYSINQGSLKDAIVRFGGGCTGSVISPEGLVLTNHHCGYSYLQRHSSLERDILKDGFWANTREEELRMPGLTVTFITRIEDVTGQVVNDVVDELAEDERAAAIAANIERITSPDQLNEVLPETPGSDSRLKVIPFYAGNEYYLIETQTFDDIRLVGVPPSAVGKFGGDTDNWDWPRHTGDFALFRIYSTPAGLLEEEGMTPEMRDQIAADSDPYFTDNYLPISIAGVDTGDFTMVFGFPGRTTEYLPAIAVEEIIEVTDPARIKLRQMRLDVINREMAASDKVRIQYAAKQSSIANGWKKWIGEVRGLRKLDAVNKKRTFEARFQSWADSDPYKKQYSSILSQYDSAYAEFLPYSRFREYLNEAFLGTEILLFAWRFYSVYRIASATEPDQERLANWIQRLRGTTKSFFKDYHQPIDREIMPQLLRAFHDDLAPENRPPMVKSLRAKYRGNWEKHATKLFKKSILANEEKLTALLDKGDAKSIRKLRKDRAFKLMSSVLDYYFDEIRPEYDRIQKTITYLDRIYVRGLRMMQPEGMYPDANSTMRIAYGQVEDYYPVDGKRYDHITTLEGVMEKAMIDNPEYEVPEKLESLYEAKDYGRYGHRGTMPVCFIASNHTTGGNSGSPVLNGKGELIGLNFDRNWEGTMSDIMYDANQCRNIMVDARYILFIIDKFAGASHLVEEMVLRWENVPDDMSE